MAADLDPTDIDEIVVATCADVWQRLNLTRGGEAFGGFVLGRLLEQVRAARRAVLIDPDARHADGAAIDAPGTEVEGPADHLTRRIEQLREGLAEVKARNPRHYRAVELVHGQRATVAEAADILGAEPAAVLALLNRARLALADSLARAGRPPVSRAERRPGPGPAGRGRRTSGPGRPPGRRGPPSRGSR